MYITTSVFRLFILNLVGHGTAMTKIWKYDFDIFNPENWEDEKFGENCDGLSFDTSSSYITAVIDRLNVKRIELLEGNSLQLLDGAVIDFEDDSDDIMNCVRVKIKLRDPMWASPDNWIIQGDEDNAAIPHQERPPCVYDDVIFPKGWKSAICNLEMATVKSFTFGNESLTSVDLLNMYKPSFGIFGEIPLLHLTQQGCKDVTGCACGNEYANREVCDYVQPDINLRCVDAITPIGFCKEICGASVVFRRSRDFRIEDVRTFLKRYSSDTYVSKVKNETRSFIQVIFTEKQFSGSSLDDANHFYTHLLSDPRFGITRAELYASSTYLAEGSIARTTFSIIFGTLCVVVTFFGMVFLLYSSNEPMGRIRDRLRLSSRPLSSFKANFFARFENTDSEALVIGDSQSLGGSILSIDKSFDNPMYGKSTPSTASTSYDTIPSGDIKVTASEISIENPVYDLNNFDKVEEVAEEGELIDLGKRHE